MASRFFGNLYTSGVSIFRLPSAVDPVHLAYLDFHNTATTTTSTTTTTATAAAAAATAITDDNVFIIKI